MTDRPTADNKKSKVSRPKLVRFIEKELKEHSTDIPEPPHPIAEDEMTPPPLPPLTLVKPTQPNYIIRTTGREVVDRRKIAYLLKSGKVSETPYNFAEMKSHHAKQLQALKINSPHNHLQLLYRKIKNGAVSVQYKREGKKPWGRAYPEGMISLGALPRNIRNLIARDEYTDFDLASAHPSIFASICSKNGIKCEAIQYYLNKKEEVRSLFYKAFSLNPKEERSAKIVKDLINSTMYGGGQPNIERWYKEWSLKGEMPSYHKTLTDEIHRINKELIKNNEVLKEFARNTKKTAQGGKDAGWELTFLSYYAQEHEIRLLGSLMERLDKDTEVFKHRRLNDTIEGVFEYEYDGFKVLTRNIIKEFQTTKNFCDRLNEWSRELGYEVCWEEKKMETDLNWEGLTDDFVEFDEKEVRGDIEALLKRLTDPLGIKTDAGMARYINRELAKDKYIFKEGIWKCWEEDANKWNTHSTSEYPRQLSYVITEKIPMAILDEVEKIREKIGDEILSEELAYKMDEVDEVSTKLILRLQDTFNRNKIFGACETECCRDVAFDANGWLLGFTNGVFDLREMKFRPYNMDDFVSMTTGWAFDEADWLCFNKSCETGDPLPHTLATQIDEVWTLMRGIIPHEGTLELLLTIYASSLVGKCLEKFIIFNGGGRNGKGLLNEFWASCLGDYGYNDLPYEVLTDPINSTGGNPAIAKINLKRWARASEPKKTKKLCNATLKLMTGGDGVQGRALYSNKTTIINHLTLTIECNERLMLQDEPQPNGAEEARFIDILYPNRFTENRDEVCEAEGVFLGNPMYKEDSWRHPHRSALLLLVLRRLVALTANNFSLGDFVPPEVQQRTKAYLQSNIGVHKIMGTIAEKIEYNAETPTMKIPCVKISDLVSAIHEELDDHREIKKDCWKKLAIKQFFATSPLYKKNYKDDHSWYDEMGNKQHAKGVLLWYKLREKEEGDSQ